MPVDLGAMSRYVASIGGGVDYISELKRLRQGDGLVFRKTEREVKLAMEERIGEIQASMRRRAERIVELSSSLGIGSIDRIMQRVNELRDPYDVDPMSYEPGFGLILAYSLAHRIEDNTVKSLRLMAQNVTGDMELSFSAFDLLFVPYSHASVDAEVSLNGAERRFRELSEVGHASPARPARKSRRVRDDDGPYDAEHFLSGET